MKRIVRSTLLFCVFFALVGPAVCPAAEPDYYVSAGSSGGDGTLASPFGTIQASVDAASDSGEAVIAVAAGTYSENVHVSVKAVRLLGGYSADFSSRDATANTTRIRGDGTDSVVTLYLAGASVVDGFTISGGGGSPDNMPYFYAGGGIYAVEGAPTISNNIIENNDITKGDQELDWESQGGGVCSLVSDMTVDSCIIRNNTAGIGAGIKTVEGTVVIRDSIIEGNVGVNDHGGGMHIGDSIVTITRNTIRNNEIGRALGWGQGGGLIVYGDKCKAELTHNIVYNNYAPSFGAGEFVDDGATATLSHELIYNNTCANSGAAGSGIYCDGWGDIDEHGGSKVTVDHCTVVGNTCGPDSPNCGLRSEFKTDVTVTNSIFWNNDGSEFTTDGTGGVITVTSTCADQTVAGDGNIYADPLFADVQNSDFHLKSKAGRYSSGTWVTDKVHSPAIDAAAASAEYSNEPVPNGSRANMGAYGNTAEASKTSDGGAEEPEEPEQPGSGEMPATWTSYGIGGGGALFSATISPHNSDEVYISTDMTGVYHSTNFGSSWNMLPFRQLQGGSAAHVRFTSDPNILYALDRSKDSRTPKKSIDAGVTWSTLDNDPTYGEAFALFADGASTQRILMAGYDAVYFSKDGGQSFTSVHSGQGSDGDVLLAGVFWDGQNIYAGTSDGLLISQNGGESFALADVTGIPADESIVSMAGAKTGGTVRLFAVTLGKADAWPGLTGAELNYFQGIYRLDWGGGQWVNTSAGLPAAIKPFFVGMGVGNIDTVYVAGGNTELERPIVYKSTDGGGIWNDVFITENNANISTGYFGYMGDHRWWFPGFTLGFAVCPADPDRLVITDLSCVHVSDNGGASWQQAYVDKKYENPAGSATPKGRAYAGIGLEQTSVWSLHWSDKDTLFACFTDIRGIRSTDAGKTWTVGKALGLPHNTTYRLVQTDDGTLYGATSSVHDMYESTYLTDARIDNGEGYVIYSADNGASWETLHDFGHPVVWLMLDPDDEKTLYASVVDSTEGGIYVTSNLDQGTGATWTKLAAPPRTQGHPYNIRVLEDGTLVCSYSGRMDGDGDFTESSGVYVSTDGGTSWQDRSDANMRRWVKDIVIDPHDSTQNTWYACVWSHWANAPIDLGGLYRTKDRGLTWKRLISADEIWRVHSITIDPQDPDFCYITTETEGLWYSKNLTDEEPTFIRDETYPFAHPVRVLHNPYRDEIWVTSYGAGLFAKGTGAASSTDYTGWWYDPKQSGKGVSLQVNGGKMFLTLYDYAAVDGKAVWFVSTATQSENTFSGTLEQYSGWPLNGGDPAAGLTKVDSGTVNIVFTSASAGALNYSIGGSSGTWNIKPYMDDIAPGSEDSRPIHGWWWDANFPGMGLFIQAQGNTMYTGWYNYRSDGSACWWVMGGWNDIGGFPAGGGSYSSSFSEYTVAGTPSNAGPATLTINSSTAVTLSFGGKTYSLTPYSF